LSQLRLDRALDRALDRVLVALALVTEDEPPGAIDQVERRPDAVAPGRPGGIAVVERDRVRNSEAAERALVLRNREGGGLEARLTLPV
jgi:hypothetical protein